MIASAIDIIDSFFHRHIVDVIDHYMGIKSVSVYHTKQIKWLNFNGIEHSRRHVALINYWPFFMTAIWYHNGKIHRNGRPASITKDMHRNNIYGIMYYHRDELYNFNELVNYIEYYESGTINYAATHIGKYKHQQITDHQLLNWIAQLNLFVKHEFENIF